MTSFIMHRLPLSCDVCFRAEAEYAWHSGRDVIILLLQENYEPEGWMSAVAESRVTFDFSSEALLDVQLPNLIRQLGTRGRQQLLDVTCMYHSIY